MVNRANKILIVTIILTIIGLYEVYSSSSVWALYITGDSTYYFNKQLIFMIIGYFALFFFYKVNLDKIYKYYKFILLISFI